MRAKPVRIQARKVRSTARKSRGVALDSSDMAKAQSRFLAKPQNQYSTNDEKERRGGESGLDVEGAPEEADQEAERKATAAINGARRADGHAGCFFGDQSGGGGISNGSFGAAEKPGRKKTNATSQRGWR